MPEQLLEGLALVVQWPSILYLLLGVVLGLWFGAIPGLGGLTAMVLVLPFTFGMEPTAALAMLLGVLAVATTSDTISSVMLGIPGTIASQATVLDGHGMARNGQPQTAFGAAFTVSALGGIVGGIALGASLPIMMWLVLAFGSPEFFVLSTIGLIMVGAVSGNAVTKGICAAAIGLLISQIGFPVTSSVPRYWFGERFLLDGLPLVPVVLGLFGIPEMMNLAARGTAIAARDHRRAEGDSIAAGIREALRHRWLAVRCSLMGTYIGMLPGLGASVVDWLAYGHAVQGAKDRSRFGQGDVRGVIAPESANNATLGGSLIPTLSFGIPGSGAMAILLGAMTIHGLVPGPAMLRDNLSITYGMVWSIILANIVGVAVLLVWSRQVARVAFINGHLVVPAVVVFLIMGSWIFVPDMLTLVTLLAIGLFGFFMKSAGWPRPPLILGFVLGPVMENALAITAQSYTVMGVVTRPTVIGLTLLLLVLFALAVRSVWRRQNDYKVEVTTVGRGSLWLSGVMAVAAFAMFLWAWQEAQGWTFLARLFPIVICIAGMVMALMVLIEDGLHLRRFARARAAGEAGAGGGILEFWLNRRREFAAFATFAAAVALIPWLGHAGALVAFVFVYLLVWGRFTVLTATLYAAAIAVLLFVVYHRMLRAPMVPTPFLGW